MTDALKRGTCTLAAVLIILPASFLLSCSKGDAKEARSGPGGSASGRRSMEFPVEVRPVESRSVEYSVTAVGSLDAFERVAVTARVAGAVERVLFREGQIVTRGQTLVEIEPERYRLAVQAASASVNKQLAAKAEAEAGYSRRVAVSEKKTVSVAILTELVSGDVYQWGSLMAGSLLGSLPVAIFYSFFVDYYVSSLTGAVKE